MRLGLWISWVLLVAWSPAIKASEANNAVEVGQKLAERLEQLRPGIPIENVVPIAAVLCSTVLPTANTFLAATYSR